MALVQQLIAEKLRATDAATERIYPDGSTSTEQDHEEQVFAEAVLATLAGLTGSIGGSIGYGMGVLLTDDPEKVAAATQFGDTAAGAFQDAAALRGGKRKPKQQSRRRRRAGLGLRKQRAKMARQRGAKERRKTRARKDYEARLEELSKDPEGGANNAKTKREAKVALDLEAQGKLPAPIRRPDDRHSGDFVDGTGVNWDVKAPQSRATIIKSIKAKAVAEGRPPPDIRPDKRQRGEYKTEKELADFKLELRSNERIIVDTKGLNAEDLTALKDAVGADPAFDGKIIFYE